MLCDSAEWDWNDAKRCQGLPMIPTSKERLERTLCKPLEGARACWHLIEDFRPSEPWGNKFVLSSVTRFTLTYYGSCRNRSSPCGLTESWHFSRCYRSGLRELSELSVGVLQCLAARTRVPCTWLHFLFSQLQLSVCSPHLSAGLSVGGFSHLSFCSCVQSTWLWRWVGIHLFTPEDRAKAFSTELSIQPPFFILLFIFEAGSHHVAKLRRLTSDGIIPALVSHTHGPVSPFTVVYKNLLLSARSWRFMPVFSSKSFIVLALGLRTLFHFE